MSSDTSSSNTSKYTLPKLASDGSNWVTYRDRMVTILAAKALMPHIRGQARMPPAPPPYVRQLPHVPPTTAASAPAQTGTTTATQGSTGTTGTTTSGTTTSTTPPPTDQYSGLTDEEYEKLSDLGRKNPRRYNVKTTYPPFWDINIFGDELEKTTTNSVKIV